MPARDLSQWHLKKLRHKSCKAHGHSQSIVGFVEKRKTLQDAQANGKDTSRSAGRHAALKSPSARAAEGTRPSWWVRWGASQAELGRLERVDLLHPGSVMAQLTERKLAEGGPSLLSALLW